MSIEAYISHATARRLRLKIPEKKGDPDYFSQLSAAITALDGVEQVKANPLTGSLLITHHGPLTDTLADIAQQQGWFTLQPQPEFPGYEPTDIMNAFIQAFERSDETLRARTKDSIDLPSLVFLSFVLLGIRQVLRGNALGPGISLFWYAYEMLHFLTQRRQNP